MKWMALVVALVLLQVSCVQKPIAGLNEFKLTEKYRRVAISVSDDEVDGYIIDYPVPPERTLKVGDHPVWTIVNNTSSQSVVSVKIGNFRSRGDDSICDNGMREFALNGDIPAGQEKTFPADECSVKDPGASPKRYRYNITARIGSGASVTMDPIIVITR